MHYASFLAHWHIFILTVSCTTTKEKSNFATQMLVVYKGVFLFSFKATSPMITTLAWDQKLWLPPTFKEECRTNNFNSASHHETRLALVENNFMYQ